MGILGWQAELAQNLAKLVGLEEAAAEPYSLALSYPRVTRSSVDSRIVQLRKLGVTRLEFIGPLKIGNVSVLGKGVAGIVILGLAGSRKVALKVRREDSRRENLDHEAVMLQAANDADVGPGYLGNTSDVLAMEFVEGESLPAWLSGLKGRGRKARLRATTRVLLEQCFRLDKSGLDHGELSRAHKNVIVSSQDKPWIVDFESASFQRRVSNVTSLTQYLFLGGGFAKKLARAMGPVEREQLLECLRAYKKEGTAKSLGKILALLGV